MSTRISVSRKKLKKIERDEIKTLPLTNPDSNGAIQGCKRPLSR